MLKDYKANGNPFANKLQYIERFKALRDPESKDVYDYFVVLRIVIPYGVTVSYGQVKQEV